MPTAVARREALKELFVAARGCERCPQLVSTRTQVVFGGGDADADLMLVGEAPGADEDRRGLPFVGRAGRTLDELLAGIGLGRDEVFVANVLKCRPPGNRDPLPEEIERCSDYLEGQLELVRPRVVVTLGSYATKLVRGDPAGITRVRGQAEVRVLGARAVRLLPVFHPAAALYRSEQLEVLRADFALIPGLLAQAEPEQPAPPEPPPVAPAVPSEQAARDDEGQLGLF